MKASNPQLFVAIFFAIAAWEGVSYFSQSSFVPSSTLIASAFVESLGYSAIIRAQGGGARGFPPHVLMTGVRYIACLCAGVVIAAAIVFLAWRNRRIRVVCAVLAYPFHVVPPLIAIPIAASLVGVHFGVAWTLGMAFVAVSSVMYLLRAAERVPPRFVAHAALSGASRMMIMRKVVLPGALTHLRGPLKVVSSSSLGFVLLLEYLVLPSGLGRVMKFAVSYQSVEVIIVSIIWAVILGRLVDGLIEVMYHKFAPWGSSRSLGE